MELDALYNQIIVENSRALQNRHKVEDATAVLEGVNPSCGDDITLELRVKDGIIEDAGFMGNGCAISQASASLMIDLILGRTVDEAKKLLHTFFGMIKGDVTDEGQLEALEEAVALQGISHLPARVKCAVLAWHTLEEALDGKKTKTETL
ncbi:Fe-S cluster assembly sulfur transfer protein SufU [Clostridium sp. Marseille-P2415]|uniref:Fe-S cluster assembly sulfur transfer protein SufU n=1 Tax=Clostridium sp. Marseille-P2415 TaxID=1805471 RepID=UPI000988780C|nr:SUF system NifU family Fe-S cluster assembly protein [Clostridium sp. Marseille-P2415]